MNTQQTLRGETAPAAPLCPKGDFGATRTCIVPEEAGHEIQRRQQVSQEGRKFEAAVAETEMQGLRFGLLARGGDDYYRRDVDAVQRPSYRLEMAPKSKKTHKHVFEKITSFDNLLLASKKARKGKTKKQYVVEFEKQLHNNLYQLQWELLTQTYRPRPLTTFTVRDPKTRKISASAYPDRIVHHAIINVIGPIFESRFIKDTYANRIGKGNSAALKRFGGFIRKVSGNGRLASGARNNNHIVGYGLKADIYHYFENVDHQVLVSILKERIRDEDALHLVRLILSNHRTEKPGKGMPLGNLTSQVMANIYLAELDNFVKHELRAKYYIRYVDDFILLSRSRAELKAHQTAIGNYLSERLKLKLHPQKTNIAPLSSGLTLLGFRQFYYFRLLKKSNQWRIGLRIEKFKAMAARAEITKDQLRNRVAGWNGYARMANTYRLRIGLKNRLEEVDYA